VVRRTNSGIRARIGARGLADNGISTADRQRADTVFAALGVQRVVIDV